LRLLVGQHAASKLSRSPGLAAYNLVISSFMPTVEWLRQQGVHAELHRLAFDPRVLDHLAPAKEEFDVTFVGSFYSVHRSRTALLNAVCQQFPRTRVWGNGAQWLDRGSAVWRCYQGEAWGIEMYRILHNSRITLNHHGDVPSYANNFRLFEGTGAGTLLVTDWKPNLHEIFTLDREVVAYSDVSECLTAIEQYLERPDARHTAAQAGQERTLRDHTFQTRMRTLSSSLERLLQ
jgi:hypothetical protein